MRGRPYPASVVAVIAALLMVNSASAEPVARAAAVCADYDNQADAQRAADTRDADGDGIYCEALPCPCLRPGEDDGSPPSEPAPRPAPRVPRARAVIRHVTDGDTLQVETRASGRSRGIRRDERVRLIGIDTPETVRPGVPVECGGKQAKDHLLRMSFRDAPQDIDGDGLMDSDGIEGRQVTLRTDPSQAATDTDACSRT